MSAVRKGFSTSVTQRPALIALSGRRRLAADIGGFPANFDRVPFDLHCAEYADRIAEAGGTPVFLPLAASALRAVEACDALVVTGGADIDPAAYGETPHHTVYGVDPERDRIERALLRSALEAGKPILAICRGMQLLNVELGGTLVQHLDPAEGEHHAAWDLAPDTLVHQISCSPGSLAAELYGETHRVNSLHHQALGRLGDAVVVTATAPDGTIEAAELPGRPVFAVQWHPELVAEQPDPCFSWLVAAADRYAAATGR